MIRACIVASLVLGAIKLIGWLQASWWLVLAPVIFGMLVDFCIGFVGGFKREYNRRRHSGHI